MHTHTHVHRVGMGDGDRVEGWGGVSDRVGWGVGGWVSWAYRENLPHIFWTKTRDEFVGGNQSAFHDTSFFFKCLSLSHGFLILSVQLCQLRFQRVDFFGDLVQVPLCLVIGALQSCHLQKKPPDHSMVSQTICLKDNCPRKVWHKKSSWFTKTEACLKTAKRHFLCKCSL